VSEIGFTSDEAYRGLWGYLCAIDLLDEIHLRYRPVDEPARWLLADGRTLLTTQLVDHVWLRVLDVPKALSARGYATAGDIVIEVVDDAFGAFAAGRYRLSADGAGAVCSPSPDAADVVLDQRVLASI